MVKSVGLFLASYHYYAYICVLRNGGDEKHYLCLMAGKKPVRQTILRECKIHGRCKHSVLLSGRIKCRKCQQEYQRKYYISNKKYYKDKAKLKFEFVIKFIQRVKTVSSCKLCGESRWWVLDFHHRNPTDKSYAISTMANEGFGVAMVKAELRKCDVLCANCHRDLHHKAKSN